MHPFRFRWLPLIGTLLLMAVFLRLGWWQWSKAMELDAKLQAQVLNGAAEPLALSQQLLPVQEAEGLQIVARGHFDGAHQFFLDNQQYLGQPGVHVITPLTLEGTRVQVLVNRGWIGWGASRAELPKISVPTGLVEIKGRTTIPFQKAPLFISEPQIGTNELLQTRIRLDKIQEASEFTLQPFVVLMSNSAGSDGLVRDWPVPENKSPMHKGYAVQWLLMALVLFAFYLYSRFKKIKSDQ